MRITIYIAFSFIFIVSCTSSTIYKKPKNLIEKEKMVDIWVDIYIAKGARTVKTIGMRKNIDYVPLVLRKYQIDSAQLSESNIYYISIVDEYEKMFQEVKQRLETLQEENRPKKYKETDSLSKKEIKKMKEELKIDRKQRLLKDSLE